MSNYNNVLAKGRLPLANITAPQSLKTRANPGRIPNVKLATCLVPRYLGTSLCASGSRRTMQDWEVSLVTARGTSYEIALSASEDALTVELQQCDQPAASASCSWSGSFSERCACEPANL